MPSILKPLSVFLTILFFFPIYSDETTPIKPTKESSNNATEKSIVVAPKNEQKMNIITNEQQVEEIINLTEAPAIITPVVATEEKVNEYKKEEKKYEDTYSEQSKKLMGVYNAPYRLKIQSDWNFFKTLTYTYWQALAHDLFFGTWDNSPAINEYSTDPAQHPHKQMVDYDYGFHSGFKMGLGYKTSLDNWTIFLQYTWFMPKLHHRVSNLSAVETGAIEDNDLRSGDLRLLARNTQSGFLSPVVRLDGNWKSTLNIFDLDLARAFYIAESIAVNFHIGPKGYTHFSKEEIRARINPINDRNDIFDAYPEDRFLNKNHSWGLGGRIGANIDWLFNHIRLFGNGSYTLAFQKNYLSYKVHATETTGYTNSIDVIASGNYKDAKASVVGIMEASIGLAYQTLFWDNKYSVDISLAYEFQHWSDQIVHATYSNIQNNDYYLPALGTPYHPGNLFLQGLTATLRFDY